MLPLSPETADTLASKLLTGLYLISKGKADYAKIDSNVVSQINVENAEELILQQLIRYMMQGDNSLPIGKTCH